MATDPGTIGSWFQTYMADKPKTATYAPAQATAADWTVDKNQTVQGQMDGLLAKSSPLFQRAETRANQQSVQRGLLNSSMAVGAAQNAVIDAAMPMAQQDAGTYAESARTNANARTQTSQFNTGETNTASRFGADAENQALAQQRTIGAEGVAREFDAGETAKQRAFQTGERLGAQTFESGERAADRTFQTGERTGAETFQAGQNREQMTFQQRMQELQQAGSDAQQARDIASREAMTRLSEQGVTNRFDQELAMRGEQFNVEQVAQDRRLAQQHANTLAQMGYANTLNTANVPANFAASVSSSTMDRVNAVLADPNLDASAKKAAVDNIVNYSNNTIAWAEKFYGIDLPNLTVPGMAGGSNVTVTAPTGPLTPAPASSVATTTGPYPTPTATYGPGWTGTTPTVPAPIVPQPNRPVWESTGA